jgi:hypothetical protein
MQAIKEIYNMDPQHEDIDPCANGMSLSAVISICISYLSNPPGITTNFAQRETLHSNL